MLGVGLQAMRYNLIGASLVIGVRIVRGDFRGDLQLFPLFLYALVLVVLIFEVPL